MWPDFVEEVNPAGEVVWTWHVWDHPGTGTNQFNINWMRNPAGALQPDWTHFNTLEYNAATDQSTGRTGTLRTIPHLQERT